MAHEPWSLGLYMGFALVITVAIWAQTRKNRTIPHRVLSTLMAGVAAALTLFVWWIGQGEPNWIADQMYPVAFGVLFAVAASLSVISVALGRGNSKAP